MSCNALERHRFLWLFLERRPELLRDGTLRLLHIAPEPCLIAGLRSRVGAGYLSADLLDPAAMERIDICNIQYSNGSFDAVYCSHVLEHVPDDRKAMHELRRILRSDGWAILLVPITADHTFEDPAITDPKERLRLFGQDDHVRRYGPDYVDRLRDAGFDVQIFLPSDLFSPEEIFRYGLEGAAGEIFMCTCSTPAAVGDAA